MMLRVLACCLAAAWIGLAPSYAKDVAAAKAALLVAIAETRPGAPAGPDATARIDAAAAALEAAAGAPPDLRAAPMLADGQWANLFSSQGVVGEIDLKFMTRTLPGGGSKGGTARSLTVLQELRPEERFYRNMMVMEAGEANTPFLYIATADLGISEEKPNDLEVRFKRIEFAPARADVSLDDLRAALNVPAETPLSIAVPQDPARPASISTVTYVDEDLRINRGKDYIAVLRKVR